MHYRGVVDEPNGAVNQHDSPPGDAAIVTVTSPGYSDGNAEVTTASPNSPATPEGTTGTGGTGPSANVMPRQNVAGLLKPLVPVTLIEHRFVNVSGWHTVACGVPIPATGKIVTVPEKNPELSVVWFCTGLQMAVFATHCSKVKGRLGIQTPGWS